MRNDLGLVADGSSRASSGMKRVSRRGRVALAGVIAASAAGLLVPAAAQAVDLYWDIDGTTAGAGGATPNGQWDSTTTNWNTDAGGAGTATRTWGAGDVAIFSAGTTSTGTFSVNVSGAQTVGGITVQEGVLTLSGDQLTLTGPTISAATATTINNVLAGAVGLTKAGGSTLTLGGANTYTGPTTVSAGTLVISSDAALGAVPGAATDNVFVATTLRGAGTFTLNANRTVVIGPVAGTGSGTGTFDVTTGNTFTIAGAVKANGTSTAALTKSGAGTLELAGNVSHTGAVNANAGTLLISGNGSWGGTTTVNGGVLTLSGSNTLTGATTVGNGTLNLDYRTNNNNKINAGGLLTMNHLGVVNVTGSDSGATSQSVNGLTLATNGTSSVNVTSGSNQSATLNVGAVTRGVAAVVNFSATGAGGGTATITTTNAGTNGILGGYATFDGNTWAAVSGGSVTGLTAFDVNDFSDATKNTDVTSDQSPAAGALVNSLRFNTGANLTLAGANTITTGGILVTPAGGGSITGGTVTSGAADVVVHQNSGSEFTLGTAVTGSVGLTKAGTGTLVLIGDNNNTGPYTVVAGTLKLGGSERITNSAAVVVSTGGTLDLNSNDETAGNLSGFGAISLSGNLTTGGNTAAATFSGPISGGGTLTKIGTGAQTLSGTSSYTGQTTVNAGVLSVTSAAGLGTADSGTIVSGSGAALQVSGTVTIPEPIQVSGTGVNNAGAIRKTGTTTTTLSGGVILNADSRINSDAGQLTFTTGEINNSGFNVTLGGAGNFSFTARITGSGSLIKEGTGTLIFANNNSDYTGKTVINGGAIQHNFQVGTGQGGPGAIPATVIPDYITLNGGTLINASTGSGGTALHPTKGVYLGVNGGTWAIADATAANVHIYRGVISGVGGFTKSGPAVLALTGTHTYAGPTTVAQGVLRLRQEGTAPNLVTGSLPATTDLTINTGGTFDMAAFNQTVNSVSGTGALVGNTSAATLTIAGNNATPATFSGNITNTAAAATTLKLIKEGTGTQVLAGTNQNTGAITVNGGVLQFATAGSLGGSGANMMVNAGGTAAAGYAMDQAFLSRVEPASAGVAALAADSANNLDVSTFTDLRLGAVGSATYSGTLTTGAAYRLGGGGGTLKLANAITDGKDLNVGNSGTAGGTVALSGTNRLGVLSVAGAKLDVGTGRLILTGTTGSALRPLLLAGRNETAGVAQWTGNGVTSSAAAANAAKTTGIGYLPAADKGLVGGTWGGVGPLAGTDVVTMYTYNGDINLSGTLDRDDYALLDKGYALYQGGAIAAGTAEWLNGDFNYDGAVTVADFMLIDTAFGSQGGPLSPAFLADRTAQFGPEYVTQLLAAVPEPGSVGLVAAGLVGVAARRRRVR